jgi:Contractile injection system tube protein
MPQSLTPRLTKGSLVGLDINNPVASIIVFQYNPEQLTRTLEAQTADSESADREEVMRLKGAPVETFQLEIYIDATDQLVQANTEAVTQGIYPQLASLEMLVYPKSAQVIANTALLAAGTIEILPMTAPMTFFIWGLKRVLPVKITSFTINEELYDVNLNPIRAKVDLSLRVLSYNDLSITDPGYYVYLANQIFKESLATANSLTQVGSTLTQVLSSITT